MSTHDLNIANDTFPNVRSDLNSALAAIGSQQAGTADPATMYAYEQQARTDLGQIRRRNAANSGWVLDGTLAEAFLIGRSSNTILAGANHLCTIIATGTFTQTLTAAATLGDGWMVNYRNDGSGVITLDPNSSEQIDGATTIDLNPGDSCIILCNASAFKTIGRRASGTYTNALTGDVALNNVSNYFTGPTVAQGTAGTWFVSGTITLLDTAGVAAFNAKLWDGTTVVASAASVSSGANNSVSISLSGIIAAPAGNLRISAQDLSATSGVIKYNKTGNSMDSIITALRIV